MNFLFSAYGQVQRFRRFVDLLVKEGDAIVNRKATPGANENGKFHYPCVWYHVLSQMWFIELYPKPLDYVLVRFPFSLGGKAC